MNSIRITSFFRVIKTGIITIINEESTIKRLSSLNQGKNFCQIIPAHTIVSTTQAFFALEQAFDASKNKTNFSRQPELEFLIHLYGSKQISKALAKVKLKKGQNKILLICAHKNKKNLQNLFARARKELGFTEKNFAIGKNKNELMKLYGISKKELQTLRDLKNPLEAAVIEKNALVVFET